MQILSLVSEDFKELASTNIQLLLGQEGSGKDHVDTNASCQKLWIVGSILQSLKLSRKCGRFLRCFCSTDRFWKTQFTKKY